MPGLLSKDTTLKYKTGAQTEFTEIDLLMEVPEIGGAPERVEVTTLKDKSKKYIMGLTDEGDLAFKFLYDNSTATSNYRVLRGLQSSNALATFQLEYPDGTAHQFDAYVSVRMDSGAVNAALTFTATMFLQSDIAVVDPV